MEQNQQPQPPVFNPQGQAQQPAPQYQPQVSASPMMDPVTAVKTCFKKYVDFKGRARRSEFWWLALFVIVASSALTFLSGLLPAMSYVSAAFTLATLIPLFSALTRRLHDTGLSGWLVALMALLFLGYYVSASVLLGPNIAMLANGGDMMSMAGEVANMVQSSPGVATVMMCCSLGFVLLFVINHILAIRDSKWGENKYGPSPKYQ
jgi:uncharacterized membrane protein YhaH (DUF805 family)